MKIVIVLTQFAGMIFLIYYAIKICKENKKSAIELDRMRQDIEQETKNLRNHFDKLKSSNKGQ